MFGKVFEFSVRNLRLDRLSQFMPATRRTFGTMHSFDPVYKYSNVSVKILPTLSDNYTYVVIDNETKDAVLIDPSDATVVTNYLKNADLKLTAILATHHHWDHVGGIPGVQDYLKDQQNDVPVYSGDSRCDGRDVTVFKETENTVTAGSLSFNIYRTPCHTTGHVCYYLESDKLVFTGDTLFLGGCGRFFEGTPEQMHIALNVVLASLPDETKIFCGHEYTLSNLKYAKHVEPNNAEVVKYAKECLEKRSKTVPLPTIPGTIGNEKKVNPFMRTQSSSELIATYEQECANECAVPKSDDPVDVMRVIRKLKDNFKPKA